MQLVEIPESIETCRNLIGGEWQTPDVEMLPVESPYTGQVIGKVPLSSSNDVNHAVAAAKKAFADWSRTPIKERSQYLFRFRQLVLDHLEELSNCVSLESGKTIDESRAGILKGIEVTEFALSLQNLDHGGAMQVSRGVSCEVRREPLGVVAGVAPFNFPAMVPMWMYPIAIALGNCFVLKPSEKVPLTSVRMGELMVEAGFPPGVFSIVHGGPETVRELGAHSDVKALAFVGSTPIAREVYTHVTSHGKRCLALGGAKNHIIVVPDADPEVTIDGVVKSYCGCAGQRCMAASLMVAVGEVDHLIDAIVERARSLQLGADMGAIISRASLLRIKDIVAAAREEGAEVVLDGSDAAAPQSYEGGFWMGPTIIDRARPEMACARTEIFGPVLTIVRVDTLREALELENKSPFGNATSVFTTRGEVARYVAEHASSGMIGVNIGVPVPREPFSFGGTKTSKFGQGDITGESSLGFWSNLKKVTTKWSMHADQNWMS